MILRRIVFFLAILLGVAASQVPEFAQQYRQRLGGAVDELNRMLTEFDADAARLQMDRARASSACRAMRTTSPVSAASRSEQMRNGRRGSRPSFKPTATRAPSGGWRRSRVTTNRRSRDAPPRTSSRLCP